MRIGLFSDTHANHEALQAVLEAFDKAQVDKLVCLGDTVGYGADPNPCCDLVRANAEVNAELDSQAQTISAGSYRYARVEMCKSYDLGSSVFPLASTTVAVKGLASEMLSQFPVQAVRNSAEFGAIACRRTGVRQ